MGLALTYIMGWYFHKYFYFIFFILLYFILQVSSFLLTFCRFIAKKSRSWSQEPSTAERKRQRMERTFLQLILLYFTSCIGGRP